jgi:hypothetical protein
MEMIGALPLLAAAIATFASEPRRAWSRWKWEAILLIAAAIIASAPLLGSFRWSFRFLPLFHLALALLGALCLDGASPRRVAAWAFALSGAATVIALSLHANASPSFAIAQLLILAFWGLGAARLPERWARCTPVAASAALLLIAYLVLPLQNAYIQPFRENLLKAGPLDPNRLYLSLYSHPDLVAGLGAPGGWGAILRPGNTAMCADLHFLNGYTSFTAAGVPELFDAFGSVDPAVAENFVSPERAGLLDFLGVDGLVFGPAYRYLEPQLGPDWAKIYSSEEADVYHHDPSRAVLAKSLETLAARPNEKFASTGLRIIKDQRQSLEIAITPLPAAAADSAEDIGLIDPDSALPLPLPSAIVFPRPYYPGYVATLNGRPIPVLAYRGIVPMVELRPKAQGTLVVRYRPAWLRFGSIIAGAACAALVLIAVRTQPR